MKKISVKKTKAPYTSISANLLGCRRLRDLSAPALQVYMWANAKWSPVGRVGIPTSSLPDKLGMTRATLCRALRELRERELLVLYKAAIRPGGPGSAAGPRCAVYDLPHRKVGAAQRFDVGDPKLGGMWRIDAERLADLACTLSGVELRVFVCAVLPNHRNKNGAVLNLGRAIFTAASVTALFESAASPPSQRSVQRALASLRTRGLIQCVSEGTGRAADVYAPDGVAAVALARRARAKDASDRMQNKHPRIRG